MESKSTTQINLAELATTDLTDVSTGTIRDAIRILGAEVLDRGESLGEISDGYHTYNELYHHRAILFSVICSTYPNLCWKSKQHHDGEMYDGMFIVGIETPQGPATYHYDIDPYWDIFPVKELPKAPEWDGHTPADAIKRIHSLNLITNRATSKGRTATLVNGEWAGKDKE